MNDGEAVAAINGEIVGSVAREILSVSRLRIGGCALCRRRSSCSWSTLSMYCMRSCASSSAASRAIGRSSCASSAASSASSLNFCLKVVLSGCCQSVMFQ